MSPVLRIVLIAGSLLALWIVVDRVRKKKIRIADSVYWVVCAVLMIIFAIFPRSPSSSQDCSGSFPPATSYSA